MKNPLHLVCASCNATVRIPADRIGESPRCPRCHTPLFANHPVELTTASFDLHVQRSDLPVVVDFWAPWCGPCRMMAPHFEEASRRLGMHARFAKVNSDEEPSLSQRFGIRGIPTLIAFRHGNEIARQSGAMDLGTLERWVNSALG